ncbi:hypothetical protein QFC19_000100 [Naganishia cerealis]|uniref:Uncharacterized protein n=1 Tax=Naganishia cerealis TaxID=610337 RepID=A0ACC2WSW7_9TREE|nr:hypothetical protein QFC19_000100 [Naganishia cerealis]
MNYFKAIKLLYLIENPEVVQLFGGDTDKLERELECMSRRKFKQCTWNLLRADDEHSEVMQNGQRRPKIRIQLHGNPILVDSRSDNVNRAIIFYRGGYSQLIDANQDKYLEECLKLPNILVGFDRL